MKLDSIKIQQNYEKILEDIKKYSPYPEKVKILFVSKYFDVEEHKALIEMGYDYFGENRAQLYRDKLNEFSDEKYKNIKWDFIGRLQKNKIKYIISSVNLIHSIDSYELLEEINKKAIENNKIINGLIEINVSKEEYQKKYDYVTTLSMGMSNDYVEALKNGATIIRIGSKLFK